MNYGDYDTKYNATFAPAKQRAPLTLEGVPQSTMQAQIAALRNTPTPPQPPPAAPARQALPEDAGLLARIRDNMAGGKANYNGLVGRGVSAFLNRSR